MFQGYSTLGAVALRLMHDNLKYDFRSTTKYSIEQAIELVCHRRKSMAAVTGAPSFLWWWFSLDQGELSLEYDPGKLKELCIDRKKWQWRTTPIGNFDVEDLIPRYNKSQWHYNRDNPLTSLEEAMLRLGLQPYQKCLSRYNEKWSTDYWGESDCETNSHLLYVEPMGDFMSAYIPVPLGPLGFAQPRFKGFSIA